MEISAETREKQARLDRYISSLGGAAVAYSAGVDSTFLLYTAHRLLGGGAIAVTAVSPASPEGEPENAAAFCEAHGIGLIVFEADLLSLEAFRTNPEDRCYHCKKYIFERIGEIAAEEGMTVILEGSNADDTGDYRPGMRALRELGIVSPLLDCGLTKEEIRALSHEAGLPTWRKPSSPCLATRFPYGESITAERLAAVGRAEALLRSMGFPVNRVRCHGDTARVEVPPDRIADIAQPGTREKAAEGLRACGFDYVSLDLEGFRSGSLNRGLRNNVKINI